jgi:hypothetical protein
MWPGVDPRQGLPLVLAGAACYGWLLAELHPSAAVWWWGLAGLAAAISVALGVRRWRRNERIAGVLSGRATPDQELAAEVDRLAGEVDDHGGLSAWGPPLAVFFVGSRGLHAALDRGDWLFAIPLSGIVGYAVVAVVLLRRRGQQVNHWLEARPRTGWRSTPPV